MTACETVGVLLNDGTDWLGATTRFRVQDGPEFVAADGNWHHVAVTVDRTNEVAVKWYVDGLKTSEALNPVAGPADNSAPLRLGRHSFSQSGYWKGEIDEVEIFKRVLRWDDVFAMYSAGRVGNVSEYLPHPSTASRHSGTDEFGLRPRPAPHCGNEDVTRTLTLPSRSGTGRPRHDDYAPRDGQGASAPSPSEVVRFAR